MLCELSPVGVLVSLPSVERSDIFVLVREWESGSQLLSCIPAGPPFIFFGDCILSGAPRSIKAHLLHSEPPWDQEKKRVFAIIE